MFVNPAVDLVLVSALFAVISQTIQLLLLDRKETRQIQKKMKEKNKEYQELIKQGGTNKAELERVQGELMELSMGSMKRMPKVMIANMIVFLPLFYMVDQAYKGTIVSLFFPLNLVWKELDWFWFYVLTSLIISMIVNAILNWYDTRNEKKNENHNEKKTVNTHA